MEIVEAFASVVKQGITWVLVVGGWLVVYQLQNIRENKKIANDRLIKLLPQVDKLEKLVVSHQTLDFDETRTKTIVRMFKGLALELSHCGRCGYLPETWASAYNQFKIASTGRNFDKGSYKKRALSDDEIIAIEAAADKLKAEILRGNYTALNAEPSLLEVTKQSLRWRSIDESNRSIRKRLPPK